MSELTRTGVEVVRVRDRNTGAKYTIATYGVPEGVEIIDEPAVTRDGRIREPEAGVKNPFMAGNNTEEGAAE